MNPTLRGQKSLNPSFALHFQCIVVLMAVCGVLAKPGLPLAAPLAYSAPVAALQYAAAPAVVAAQSSQVISRNYNGIATPDADTAAATPLAYSAPYAAAAAAPLGYSAYAAGHLGYSAPLAASPLGYSAYSAYSPYAAAPYVL